MIPVINMGILTLLYKGTAALIQPVSDKRIVEAISFTGEGYHMLLKTVLATAVLFLVTLAVAASAARRRDKMIQLVYRWMQNLAVYMDSCNRIFAGTSRK